MLAYGLWRLADAAFGMENPGGDGKAMRKRAAAGVIGRIYLYLGLQGGGAAAWSAKPPRSSPEQQADTVLDLPGGASVLGLAALVLLVAGAYQLKTAFKCAFLRRLDHRAPGAGWSNGSAGPDMRRAASSS